ncbi:hypothetical protein [Cyclobacterium qasimii]|uniref:Uncharacterized protein n=1 Tax=Cyclobacterium qasimii M12-11B TaxID=641524 RepID=S7WWG8_9BACT|nr:hypothetical protein [Cyclobacterium qasimii]EPR71114.1 hypothetical protein ADICYQ_0705 [Cyclobacterium qasimii M12-11B]
MKTGIKGSPFPSIDNWIRDSYLFKTSISIFVFLLEAGICFSQRIDEKWFSDNYSKMEGLIPIRGGMK